MIYNHPPSLNEGGGRWRPRSRLIRTSLQQSKPGKNLTLVRPIVVTTVALTTVLATIIIIGNKLRNRKWQTIYIHKYYRYWGPYYVRYTFLFCSNQNNFSRKMFLYNIYIYIDETVEISHIEWENNIITKIHYMLSYSL